jgi:PAS domain S-box-containing protein
VKAEETAYEANGTAQVLLVDDRPENLAALEAVLSPLGYGLVKARSGEEAMKLLLKHEFAVVLLDVRMPGLDGFQTAEYIRGLERTRHIPIIFITAHSKDEVQVIQGYTAGAVDYVFKPFDPVVLRSKIAVFIELFEKKRALQEGEERFRKAFEDAPIGVALVDPQGRWLRVNRALCEMLGHPEARFLSSTVGELIHPDDSPLAFDQLLVSLGLEGRSFHTEQRFVGRDGQIVHGLVSISLVRYTQLGEPYFILQINDVTEQKRLEDFRRRFIANAAHELRTPVSVLAGTSALLSKGRSKLSNEEIDKCLDAMHRQGDRLGRLVEGLLDLTRLQEGIVGGVPLAVPLLPTVNSVVETAPPPEGKRLEVLVDDEMAALVDAQSLDQILMNLVTNAYKYGGANIRITAQGDDDTILLEVADDGAGIPDDLIERVFEPFTRGRDSANVGGSGLGLSLARGLAQACGGDIDFYPNEPTGARFIVRLKAADGP